ncbi:hypothetical protein Ade02nite_67080 [Paractinoplanes deccanensis]|uniref:ApeA N-terminal domain-containing protein n=1 Tax=Paractinoplanes deccanensis TaxID=113561 RepID=A0ABQ3YDI1_9ACTN|nr:hypothetical protein [Actinoplanes deccanensis]GID78067.1 hypothetical protein Ade02nite_67080 [Actinoplanes deccanensis]
MEYFRVDGTWWLPDDPGVRTVGTLSLGADELSLDLDGSIDPGESQDQDLFDLPEWRTTPVIHGKERGGGDITLLYADGATLLAPTQLRANIKLDSH